MLDDKNLQQLYPSMRSPIRCENGCGAVIEMFESFRSYQRDQRGDYQLICECCASEIGHVDESDEAPDESPVCHRRPKESLPRI
jgi:rubrerythrin